MIFTVSARAYKSNILKAWTPEAQQSLLDGVEEELTIYEDQVRPGQRKRKAVDALVQRADMLRPTKRRRGDEVIYVPCLGNFAWDLWDLARCFAAAKEREATIVALNTDLRIPPDASEAVMKQAREDFQADKRRGAVQPGRVGWEIAQEQRLADTERRINLIREDWGNPDFKLEDLLLRAGRTTKRGHVQPMAYVTAKQHLGVRSHIFKVKAGQARARARRKENQR